MRRFCVSARGCVLKRMQSSTADPEVIHADHGATQLLTLNRPKALNALNWSMVQYLQPLYDQWKRDHAEGKQRVVVMKGAGGKAFCAGGDVVAIAQDKGEGKGQMRKGFFRDEYRLNYTIKTAPFPHIALLDGVVMGGGVGLSVHGSHRIVTDTTLFAMPETGIGLFPDVGGSLFLPRLPHAGLGCFLALTGHRLKGSDVLHAAVGTHFVAHDRLPALEKALLEVGGTAAVDHAIQEHAQPREQLPGFSLEPHLSRIARSFTLGSVDDIIADLRVDETEWTKKQLDTLAKASPTSLRVTHEQIMRGARQSPHENFAMEARIVWAMMHRTQHTDFDEGIRALLIDKDKNPKWDPPTLAEVTPEIVAQYFVEPGDGEWSAE